MGLTGVGQNASTLSRQEARRQRCSGRHHEDHPWWLTGHPLEDDLGRTGAPMWPPCLQTTHLLVCKPGEPLVLHEDPQLVQSAVQGRRAQHAHDNGTAPVLRHAIFPGHGVQCHSDLAGAATATASGGAWGRPNLNTGGRGNRLGLGRRGGLRGDTLAGSNSSGEGCTGGCPKAAAAAGYPRSSAQACSAAWTAQAIVTAA